MYYICGKLNDYSYMFDSSDCSCELIRNDSLTGLNYSIRSDTGMNSIEKAAMLYGFSRDQISFYKKMCTYKVRFEGGGYGFELQLVMRLFPLDEFQYCGGSSDTSTEVSYVMSTLSHGKKFMLFMNIIVEPTQIPVSGICMHFDPELKIIMSKQYRLTGLPFPFVMLDYLVKLVRNRDFSNLDRAFCGVLYENARMYNIERALLSGVDKSYKLVVHWE